jgi:hypothetical protein
MKGLLAALPFFSKHSEPEVKAVRQQRQESSSDSKGLTGVSKYVENMPVTTGVEKYLGRQEVVVPVYTGSSGVEKYLESRPKKSGVEKYLETNKSSGATGVTKYVRNQPEVFVSGVDRYVANQLVAIKDVRKPSGVDKYLSKQVPVEKAELSSVDQYVAKYVENVKSPSSVDRYVSKKVSATRVSSNATGVEKYQIEQEIVARKEAAAVIVEDI